MGFHNADKTFLVWVNEEDQLRIISMQKGGDVKGVFERLARGIKAVGDSVKAESGKDFQISPKFGYIHSCPTNLGTGRRASTGSRRGARSARCSPGAPGGSRADRPATPTTSPTSTASATPRSSSCSA